AAGKLTLAPGTQPQVRLHFQTGDRNGMGFLDYFTLGYPTATTALSPGVFYNFDQIPISLEADAVHRIWEVSDPFGVQEFSFSGTAQIDAARIAVVDPGQTPPLAGFQPVDMILRLDT